MGGMADPLFQPSELIVPLLFTVALSNALLGAVVLRSNARQAANRTFALLAFSVALWVFANALFRTATSPGTATLWAQLAYVGSLATAASFLHFSWLYPRHYIVSSVVKAAIWLGAAALSALAFVPGFMIETVDVSARRIVTGPGIYLLALFLLLTSASGFLFFLHTQARLRGRARAQARYVLYGSAVAAALGFGFNLLLPLLNNYRWVWLGPLCSVFFVGCCAYSIVAARLFDVRLLIRRTLVYSFLLALLAGAFAALQAGAEHLLRPLLGRDGSLSPDLLAALLVGAVFDPLKRQLHAVAAHRLFKDEHADERDDE